MAPLRSVVASEASALSAVAAGHCAHGVGILAQETGCFFFQGQRSELPTSLPHPHVTSSLLFTAYSQPDWVKIKRLYLFPCGG